MSTNNRPKEYRIEFVNSILDNVHGFISLTKIENEIERLPIFKRLQNISQLGLSHRIFPCALHNRYIHSLGVMFIADQMAVKLKLFNDNERQLLRLAGMLHDIGHYPLSHDVEHVYRNSDNLTKLLGYSENVFMKFKDSAIKSIEKLEEEPKIDDLRLHEVNSTSLHHENVGAMVLKNSKSIKDIIQQYYVKGNPYFHRIDNPVDRIITEISNIITGNAQYDEPLFGKDKYSVMVQLMHSEIDADRIDYLLRDATFSGASYGTFDLGMLIQTLQCGNYHDAKIVGVNYKGIGCAEQFLINRYLAYNQVINHKYTSILGCVVQAIVTWLLMAPNEGFQYRDVKQMVETHEKDTSKKFWYYTDNAIMSFINNLDENNPTYPEEIRILLRCLKRYLAFDMASEEVVVDSNPKNISKRLKSSEIYSRLINSDNRITKIYQYREIMLTSHIPIDQFEELLEKSRKNDAAREKYLIDRMQEGAAVVEDGKEPHLLIDSDRSMIKKLAGIRYSILREYDFDAFRDIPQK